MANRVLTFEDVMTASYHPIREAPTVADGTATTTPAVLFTDVGATSNVEVRRVRVVNTHATETLGVLLFAAGTSLTGKTVADGAKLPPGTADVFVITRAMRIGIVGSGSCTYNAICSDFRRVAV